MNAFQKDRIVFEMTRDILLKLIPLFPEIPLEAIVENGSYVSYLTFRPILHEMGENR